MFDEGLKIFEFWKALSFALQNVDEWFAKNIICETYKVPFSSKWWSFG